MFKNLKDLREEKGTLVASHRGTSTGNIPCNTIAAFDIALKEGADILEMDLFKSVDGEIFVFHTGMEPSHLDRHIHIERLTAEEIKNLRLCNGDLEETFISVNKFDDVLEHFKGRAILNLDRSIKILDSVIEVVERHNMREQILLKSDPSEQSLKMVETFAPEYDYMPIFMEKDCAFDKIENMNINCVGAELVFASEDAEIAQDSYIEKLHKKGKIVWMNSLVYSSKVPLAAGHSDDISLTDDPEKGWGWLVDKGADIIQTDWTYHCVDFLKNRKR